jgi:carboxypeptidase Q
MPRFALTVTLLIAFATPAVAQEPVDRAMIARLRAEGMDRSKVDEVFNHLTNVAGPRLTGTPAYNAAANYVKTKFSEWGLANSHLEAFPFGRGWTLDKLVLEMTAPRYFPLIGYPEAWTPSMKAPATGTPIYLGDKTAAEIEAMGEKLRGAIILPVRPQAQFAERDRIQPAAVDSNIRSGAPSFPGATSATPLNTMRPLLQRFGAAVILRPSPAQHGTAFVLGQRNTRDDAVPSIILTMEHYNTIVRASQAGAAVKLNVDMRSHYETADTNTYNIIAEIPGEDPALKDQVVLIGAHMDSWHSSNGATDNADGVAGMMEAMRILKASGVRPRRTIRVAIWSGEEQGLLGARFHADKLYGPANVAARDKISVYLNDDPGTGATLGFYMENNPAAKAIFDAWLEPLKELGMMKNVIGPIGSTDHLAFTAFGIPGFTAIKDYTHYDVYSRHSNTDFYERVNTADLKQSAIVMAVFAYHAAMRDLPIPRAPAAASGRGGQR